MGKIRIAYVIDRIYSGEGGTEKQLLGIISRLDKSRFDPFLILLYETEWIHKNSLPCDFIVLNYKGFLKRNIFTELSKFRNLLKERDFHILQTFFVESIFFCFVGTCWGFRPKILLSSRRDIGMGSRSWYHAIYSLLMPLINLKYDGVVANSENVKHYVTRKECVPAKKIAVIKNGIDMRITPPSKPEVFTQTVSDLWIGIVANLTPVKRHDVFLQALSILKTLALPVRVKAVILGEGPENDRLMMLSHDLGIEQDVFFLGSQKNVTAYLQNLDIGVLCSDREGLSNSILEYMVHSLPVVATAVGGNTELVDASNGICVPPGEPEALAIALKTVISDLDLRRRMGRKSRERIESMFSWERTMQEWQNYYQNILSDFQDMS